MLQALPKKFRSKVANYFMSPSRVIDGLDIRPGSNVLELGMPIGLFAPSLLKKVLPNGTVYIAGPNDESFEKFSQYSNNKNIKFELLADLISGGTIPPGTIDTILLTNLLSNTLQPDSFCLALGQYLKADSEIVLIDWDSKFQSVGPKMERRVTKEDALKLMNSCGMIFKRILNLPGYHYGMVFSFKPN